MTTWDVVVALTELALGWIAMTVFATAIILLIHYRFVIPHASKHANHVNIARHYKESRS